MFTRSLRLVTRRAPIAPSRRTFIHRTYLDIKEQGMVKVSPSGTCESRRYILKKDDMGFSLHRTIIFPHRTMYIHYKRHLEAVMCIQGACTVELVSPMAAEGTGRLVRVEEGDVYALDGHESHYLRAGGEDCHLVCVFNPGCTGQEVQGKDGSFELLD